jgi:hypothetical protein
MAVIINYLIAVLGDLNWLLWLLNHQSPYIRAALARESSICTPSGL